MDTKHIAVPKMVANTQNPKCNLEKLKLRALYVSPKLILLLQAFSRSLRQLEITIKFYKYEVEIDYHSLILPNLEVLRLHIEVKKSVDYEHPGLIFIDSIDLPSLKKLTLIQEESKHNDDPSRLFKKLKNLRELRLEGFNFKVDEVEYLLRRRPLGFLLSFTFLLHTSKKNKFKASTLRSFLN